MFSAVQEILSATRIQTRFWYICHNWHFAWLPCNQLG